MQKFAGKIRLKFTTTHQTTAPLKPEPRAGTQIKSEIEKSKPHCSSLESTGSLFNVFLKEEMELFNKCINVAAGD